VSKTRWCGALVDGAAYVCTNRRPCPLHPKLAEQMKMTAWAKCTTCGSPVLINGTFCAACLVSGRA
jgi:hypothetical protein